MKRQNTIVFTAGGSGGHLTPLLAVARAVKTEAPGTKLVYIGQRGDSLQALMQEDPIFQETYTIFAGKLRRYHGEGIGQLLDVVTQAKNLRDAVYILIGLVQSWFLLRRLAPKVVFSRGGFVSVPVCLAAAAHRIPFTTHDSDAVPSLANRLIAKYAAVNAVALPAELYPYPAAKTVTVGVPVQAEFTLVTPAKHERALQKLGLPPNARVLLVIGGGLGAQRVNQAVVAASPQLFTEVPHLVLFHVAGQASEAEVREGYNAVLTEAQQRRVQVYGFTKEVALLSEAADVVITRAGATTLAEFAIQGRACIIIPNPQLTGGHQLKNAYVYKEKGAAEVLVESQLPDIGSITAKLLLDPARQQELAKNITQFAYKDATGATARLLLTVAQHKS